MIVLAHLSDIHLDGGARNAARTAQVMAYLEDLPGPVDAILVTGDLTDHGAAGEYEQARSLLSSSRPVFTLPGNHDVRAAYRAGLLGERGGAQAPVNQAHEVAGAVFALCDSVIPGRVAGALAAETLTWLAGVLESTSADTPVFVGVHHPPVALGNPAIDEIRLLDAQPFAELIARYPQVVAVLCGHAHTAAATTFAGRPLLVAPGVAATFRLPWERGELVDQGHPPGVAFHVLGDDGRLVTHYRLLPLPAEG
jgi:3',5'-cyclic AMP phosphodiesterase CpdA